MHPSTAPSTAHRLLRSHAARLAGLAVLLPLLSPAGAAQATLTRTNGVLGGTLDHRLEGDPGEIYVLLPSLSAGPTPVGLVNPGDPRLLSVGLDQPGLWSVGLLAGGVANESVLLPNDPGLNGVVLHAQFVTITLGPLRVDDVSNPTTLVLAQAGTSHATPGMLSRDSTGHSATTLADGRVLVAGGSAAGIVSGGLELFDPQTQAFTALPAGLAVARAVHTATLLADGRVLVLGGVDQNDVVHTTAEIFDPATGISSLVAPMSVPRVQHTATLLADGRVFVAGGASAYDLSDPFSALASVLSSTALYDPATNTWSPGPALPRPRALHAAARLADGRVLLTGGIEITTIIVPIPSFSSDCRAYDPATGQIQNVANFNGPRALHSMLRLSNGQVLVVGGTDGDLLSQTFTPIATCRLYQPGPDQWLDVASLAAPRVLIGGVVERGGRAHVIGGLATVDLATTTGTPVLEVESTALPIAWSATGAILSGRPASVSVPIEGGQRVLTVGAAALGDRTAEIYVP